MAVLTPKSGTIIWSPALAEKSPFAWSHKQSVGINFSLTYTVILNSFVDKASADKFCYTAPGFVAVFVTFIMKTSQI